MLFIESMLGLHTFGKKKRTWSGENRLGEKLAKDMSRLTYLDALQISFEGSTPKRLNPRHVENQRKRQKAKKKNTFVRK